MSKQSIGGKVTALKLRTQALEAYYRNPSYCIYCNKIIEVKDNMKVRDAKIKKFCNHSCSSKYNNINRSKRKKTIIDKPSKLTRTDILISKTKETVFKERKNWQSARSAIQKHARRIYELSDKPKCCARCGYSLHYEISHIKSVSDFDNSALISEINNIDNLIALCPNHHWEFDNL